MQSFHCEIIILQLLTYCRYPATYTDTSISKLVASTHSQASTSASITTTPPPSNSVTPASAINVTPNKKKELINNDVSPMNSYQ